MGNDICVDNNSIVTEQTQIYGDTSHEIGRNLSSANSNRSIYVEHSYGVLNNEYLVEESYIDLDPRHQIPLPTTSTQELNEIEESDRNAVLEYIENCRQEELKKENERMASVEAYEDINKAKENDLPPQPTTQTSDSEVSVLLTEDKYGVTGVPLARVSPQKRYILSKSDSDPDDPDAIIDNTQNEEFEIEKEKEQHIISSFKSHGKRVTDLVEDERIERDVHTSDSDLCNENYVAKCADKIMRLENCDSSDSEKYQKDQIIQNSQIKVFKNKGERKIFSPPPQNAEDRMSKVKILKQKYLKMKNKKLEMKKKRKSIKGINSESEHNLNNEGE